ncbi:GNAT family N-acetyltransferase [Planctomicrobium sp. SH527]|uniref:GNAT family N-acetyltransferase n=1 Tax=Planctomicrobium sp. SH527 TaxID=3448123 RepID=UPI003F5C3086
MSNDSPIFVPYSYIRATQLEGRFPEDAGAWGITMMRMKFGEGLYDPHNVECKLQPRPDGKLPDLPASRPSIIVDPKQFISYRRVRSAQWVAFRTSQIEESVRISIPLSPGWVNPPDGVVHTPVQQNVDFENTHAFAILAADPHSESLLFRNSWGTEWGNQGYGEISFDYFDKYVFDSFSADLSIQFPRAHSILKPCHVPGVKQSVFRRTNFTAETNENVYTYSIETTEAGRLGWAIAVESRETIDIEDIYVRPEFRQRGIANILVNHLKSLRNVKNKPFRILLHWTETKRENPKAFEVMCHYCTKLGFTFFPSISPQLPYVAVESSLGTLVPPTPSPYPHRPKTPLFRIALSAAMALISASTNLASEELLPHNRHEVGPLLQQDLQSIQTTFDILNQERHSLIIERQQGTITEEKSQLLEQLQTTTRQLADLFAPLKFSRNDEIIELIRRLGRDAQ